MLAIVAAPSCRRGNPKTEDQSAALIGSFWHESSANESSRTARDGRAREPGAAGITAMPVAGGVALGGLPQAGRGQRRGSRDHGADRPAVSGSALLRLAPHVGVARDPGPCG